MDSTPAPGLIYGLRKLLIDSFLHEFVGLHLGDVSPVHYAPEESIDLTLMNLIL